MRTIEMFVGEHGGKNRRRVQSLILEQQRECCNTSKPASGLIDPRLKIETWVSRLYTNLSASPPLAMRLRKSLP